MGAATIAFLIVCGPWIVLGLMGVVIGVGSEIEDAKERIKDFREVEKGFSEEEAYRESIRCLRCDLEKEENAI